MAEKTQTELAQIEAEKAADLVRTAGAWVGVLGVIVGVVLVVLALLSDWVYLPGGVGLVLGSIFVYGVGRALAAILRLLATR